MYQYIKLVIKLYVIMKVDDKLYRVEEVLFFFIDEVFEFFVVVVILQLVVVCFQFQVVFVQVFYFIVWLFWVLVREVLRVNYIFCFGLSLFFFLKEVIIFNLELGRVKVG